MMIKKAILALAAFSMLGNLSACADRHITPVRTEYKVVMPEDKYFSGCDLVKLPDPTHMTDAQVAALINDLVKVNRICHNNNAAIKDLLEAAKKRLETNGSVTINGNF
jgi:hypothetical protein